MGKLETVYLRNIDTPSICKVLLCKFETKLVSIVPKADSKGDVYFGLTFSNAEDAEDFKYYLKQGATSAEEPFAGFYQEEGGSLNDYFVSYASSGIHRLMLGDENRNKAYYRAIVQNPGLFKNKVVLDIGAGSGILSLFAARAGAAKVFAVEAVSNMASICAEVVRKNGFEDVISVLQKRVENVEGLEGAVDVIVSEWMGYALFYEGMLLSILYARDKFLKKGGMMFPDKAHVKLVGYHYGQSTTPKEENVSSESFANLTQAACIQNCDALSTKTCGILNMDLEKWNDLDKGVYLNSVWSLLPQKNNSEASIEGLLIYFNVLFTHGESPVTLSTRPSDKNRSSNHWKQTLLTLQKPVQFSSDLQGSITIRQRNFRGLEFNVCIQNGKELTFYL